MFFQAIEIIFTSFEKWNTTVSRYGEIEEFKFSQFFSRIR